jgi:hypothetical protein
MLLWDCTQLDQSLHKHFALQLGLISCCGTICDSRISEWGPTGWHLNFEFWLLYGNTLYSGMWTWQPTFCCKWNCSEVHSFRRHSRRQTFQTVEPFQSESQNIFFGLVQPGPGRLGRGEKENYLSTHCRLESFQRSNWHISKCVI